MTKINKLSYCKNYMTCFDVMYISGSELWFGKLEHAASPDSVYLFIKDVCGRPITLRKTEALCFYNELKDSWISQIEDNAYVEFSGYTSDTLKEMASFAIDELAGNETDVRGSNIITNIVKTRFKNWFEERTRYRRYNYGMYGQLSDSERAYLYFDEKISSEVKKTMNEIYGTRNQKRYLLPPQPKFVQFNGNYTTVVWKDGSHTVVKRAEDEEYDEEKAILFAIVKHLCKNNGCEMDRYLEKFFKDVRVHVKNEKKNINKED